MAPSLSDYAGSLACLGATLAVNAGLGIAYRGRVDPSVRFQRAMMLISSLLHMRGGMAISKVWQPSLSGGEEDFARDNYIWLRCVAICFLCFALCACLESTIKWRRERARGRALPRVPPRRGNFGRRA